ncbi:MAG: CPXCG motif-containing cysteine-rich protein [Flavobacteriaceae bacterium]|nr:CPXCG motif-containing cysteine-rich protein [Flavobacteriaceae bacterium]
MIEHYFQCPHCWQEISMLIDSSLMDTEYIEDCEVCCNPILIKFSFQSETLKFFSY